MVAPSLRFQRTSKPSMRPVRRNSSTRRVYSAGVDEDVFLRIERENFESGVVAEHSDEGGVDVEKLAFEAGAVDSVDGGLHQGAVADFGAAQGLLVAFAIDGGG